MTRTLTNLIILFSVLIMTSLTNASWGGKGSGTGQRKPIPRALIYEDFKRKFKIQLKEPFELELVNPGFSQAREKIYARNNMVTAGTTMEPGLKDPYTRFMCRFTEDGTPKKPNESYSGQWSIQGKVRMTSTNGSQNDRILFRAQDAYFLTEIQFELINEEPAQKYFFQKNEKHTNMKLKLDCVVECEIAKALVNQDKTKLRQRCSQIASSLIAENFKEIGIHNFPLTAVDSSPDNSSNANQPGTVSQRANPTR